MRRDERVLRLGRWYLDEGGGATKGGDESRVCTQILLAEFLVRLGYIYECHPP